MPAVYLSANYPVAVEHEKHHSELPVVPAMHCLLVPRYWPSTGTIENLHLTYINLHLKIYIYKPQILDDE